MRAVDWEEFIFTFHPGTSFMITASSSRFSRSIRKVLKQRNDLVCYDRWIKSFESCFLCCITFGLALPASEASVLSWLPSLQSVSVCSTNTHIAVSSSLTLTENPAHLTQWHNLKAISPSFSVPLEKPPVTKHHDANANSKHAISCWWWNGSIIWQFITQLYW